MRNSNSSARSASQPPATIDDLQLIIEHALEELRPAPFSQSITDALPYLHPKGLRLRVQLEENGRKKRSNAAAWNWNPEAGRIVISFERGEAAQPLPASAPSAQPMPRTTPNAHAAPATVNSAPSFESGEVTPQQIQQCCEALDEAEKTGRHFIAFRWFRDEELLKHKFGWAESPQHRQRVIARAIETGAIQTQRIQNPKSPEHPTTAVKLNRAEASQMLPKRFNPIVVRGEPVSVTIMRDRGSI